MVSGEAGIGKSRLSRGLREQLRGSGVSVTRNGDVCNKIGTYLKALAAKDNNVPFYIALPYPTIDYSMESGDLIPIEARDSREVTHMSGLKEGRGVEEFQITLSDGANPAFDITPARLVSGYITERGILEKVCDGDSNAPVFVKNAA